MQDKWPKLPEQLDEEIAIVVKDTEAAAEEGELEHKQTSNKWV